MVELGQTISRIISMEMVIDLGEKGFRSDLIENTISSLKKEISSLIGHFNFTDQANVVEDYQDNSTWYSMAGL